MATEQDLVDGQEQSLACSESHEISREDTMVEHSVVVNEESPSVDADYLQALESVKFDMVAAGADLIFKSGEVDLEQRNAMIGKGLANFSPEEDKMIEMSLLHIRDKIRNGLPLSHQLA